MSGGTVLGLPDLPEYSESALEQRIIDHIEEFMLELGKGFTFVGRQSHISFDEDHYRPALVFYNRLTRSFFVIDLKIGKVTAGDVGQMQLYVHYYDRTQKLPDENPTVGILLGSEVKQSVVEMTLPDCEKKQVFANIKLVGYLLLVFGIIAFNSFVVSGLIKRGGA